MFIRAQGSVISVTTQDERLAAFAGGIGLVGAGGTRTMSYQQAYREQLWVHVCVNKLSRGLSRLPFKPYIGTGQDRQRIRKGDHPLADLLDSPYPGGSMFSLLNAASTEYLIEGPSLIGILRPTPGAPPDALVPLEWSHIRTYRDQGGKTLYYEWRETPTADPWRLLPEDVINLGFAKRISPLQALQHSMLMEDAAQMATRAFYENGSQLSGVFTTDRKLDTASIKSVEQQIRSEHTGADNWFRVAVLGNVPGAKWQPFGVTSKDAETVMHRKLSREEVCAAYDVPPPLVGILDQATFSNIDTQTRMWVVDTLAVHTKMIESAFLAQLIAREPAFAGCYTEFDMGEILRGTPLQQAEAFGKLLNSAARTPNQIADLQNMPRSTDPWADALYVPANLVPIGAPGPLNTGSAKSNAGTGSGSGAAAQNPSAWDARTVGDRLQEETGEI